MWLAGREPEELGALGWRACGCGEEAMHWTVCTVFAEAGGIRVLAWASGLCVFDLHQGSGLNGQRCMFCWAFLSCAADTCQLRQAIGTDLMGCENVRSRSWRIGPNLRWGRVACKNLRPCRDEWGMRSGPDTRIEFGLQGYTLGRMLSLSACRQLDSAMLLARMCVPSFTSPASCQHERIPAHHPRPPSCVVAFPERSMLLSTHVQPTRACALSL